MSLPVSHAASALYVPMRTSMAIPPDTTMHNVESRMEMSRRKRLGRAAGARACMALTNHVRVHGTGTRMDIDEFDEKVTRRAHG
jgi:hypothetical protein